MSEYIPSLITFILLIAFLILSFSVNYYYQNRARRYADEILKGMPEEYNKQIRATAYSNLIRQFIWSAYFVSSGIYGIAHGLQLTDAFILFYLIGAVCFIVRGIWNFRKELKRRILL